MRAKCCSAHIPPDLCFRLRGSFDFNSSWLYTKLCLDKLLLLSAEALSDFHLHNLFFSRSEPNIQACAPLLHTLPLARLPAPGSSTVH